MGASLSGVCKKTTAGVIPCEYPDKL